MRESNLREGRLQRRAERRLAGLLILHDYAGGDGGALRPVFRGRQAMPLLERPHEVAPFVIPAKTRTSLRGSVVVVIRCSA